MLTGVGFIQVCSFVSVYLASGAAISSGGSSGIEKKIKENITRAYFCLCLQLCLAVSAELLSMRGRPPAVKSGVLETAAWIQTHFCETLTIHHIYIS